MVNFLFAFDAASRGLAEEKVCMRGLWNWVIILAVVLVAIANPLYRNSQGMPIVTLGLDLRGGVEVLLQAVPESGKAPTEPEMKGVQEVVGNRVDPSGTKEVYLSQIGDDRVLLQVPGEKDPDAVISVIGDTALLEFVNVGNDAQMEGTNFNQEGSSERKPEFAKYETILTGADLANAHATFDQQNKPAIGFTFKKAGAAGQKSPADIFGEFTRDHVNQYLCVLLDGVVLTCPTINGAIWGGEGIIQGSMTTEDVERIVSQLNAGALPVPLRMLQSSVVGPTLGQESIDKSLQAGIIGFAIVFLLMVVFYRLPGLLATFSLALYVVVVLGFLSLFNATLTLPGIAGFLLSVGMAIDANIILYERLKEELRWGKTLTAALEASFTRGWAAIIDGQVATLLGAAVLYFFGTGPVKGFAVTLFIGNILALFTGVFVTRVFMEAAARAFKATQLYAASVKNVLLPRQQLEQKKYIEFISRFGLWISVSVVIVAAGLIVGFINMSKTGSLFNLGLDYTGGEALVLQTREPMEQDGQVVAGIVEKFSEGEATVQVYTEDPTIVSIRMRPKQEGEGEEARASSRAATLLELRTEIGNNYGGFVDGADNANPQVIEQSYVGPTVGRELIQNAIVSLFLGCLLIMGYIFVRFGQIPFSLAAVLAILHNVIITLAVTAAFGLEINANFIAVILTIIGYSINDTVIIFDRVRENLRSFAGQFPMKEICDLSLTQTLTRSFNTVLMVMVMTGALIVLGGENLRDFMIAMMAGLLATAYSSITIATPIMLMLSKGRIPQSEEPALAVAGSTLTLPRESAPAFEMESEDGASRPPRPAGGSSAGRKQRRR